MQKIFLCFLVIMLSGCAGGKIVHQQFAPTNTIHNSKIKELIASKDFNAKDINDYIIYLNKGDSFPLTLSVDSEVVDIKQKSVDIVAKQKIYLMLKVPADITNDELEEMEIKMRQGGFSEMSRAEQNKIMRDFMLYASNDGINWAPFSNIKAIKKIFGIKQGTFSFGMGIDRKDGLWSKFDIKTLH